MDGACPGSIDITVTKAYTARAFDMSTEELAGTVQSGEPLFGVHTADDVRIIVFAGGIPLARDGSVFDEYDDRKPRLDGVRSTSLSSDSVWFCTTLTLNLSALSRS